MVDCAMAAPANGAVSITVAARVMKRFILSSIIADGRICRDRFGIIPSLWLRSQIRCPFGQRARKHGQPHAITACPAMVERLRYGHSSGPWKSPEMSISDISQSLELALVLLVLWTLTAIPVLKFQARNITAYRLGLIALVSFACVIAVIGAM